jgi:hypothetical protein
MAESGLSIGFSDLKESVGFLLGYGRGGTNFADWTSLSPDPTSEVEDIVQSGIRRVYYPPAIPGKLDIAGYEWSFLRPSTTLLIGASGTDGTIVGAAFDSATYADWVTQGITTDDHVHITSPTASVGEYGISSVAAGEITLDESPGDATGLTFRVERDPANYDLPDLCHQVIGNLNYAPDDFRAPVIVISVEALLQMRARNDRVDYPSYAAIRSLSSARTTGQRQEILFWPRPNTSVTFYYAFEAYSGVLSSSYPYPLGGMYLAELYIESCLAVAEQRINNEAGLHSQAYQALLIDAVERDRKRGAKFYGRMGQPKKVYREFRRGDTGGTYPLTYNGALL